MLVHLIMEQMVPYIYLLVENAHQCNYRGSGQARAPLECPMQLAIVTCIRACMQMFKGSALMQVTIASCIGHSNGARACPDPL